MSLSDGVLQFLSFACRLRVIGLCNRRMRHGTQNLYTCDCLSRRLKSASDYLFTQAAKDSTLERSFMVLPLCLPEFTIKNIRIMYIEQRDRVLEHSFTPCNNLWCKAHLQTDI